MLRGPNEITLGDCMRQRLLRGVGLLGLFAGATAVDAQPRAAAGVGIDHLILGVDDLERGMQEFARRTGVTPIKGGVHPGRGSQNALASLGNGQYVEILAPSNEAGTTAPPNTSHRTLTAVGWALHTDDLTSVVNAVRGAGFTVSEIRAGARSRPDGVTLSWQTAVVSGAGLECRAILHFVGRCDAASECGIPHRLSTDVYRASRA